MTAKYATTCAVCASDIQPGDGDREVRQWLGARAVRRVDGGAPDDGGPTGPLRARDPEMPAADGALEVWTDGACSGNPGPGGWAWATAATGATTAAASRATTNQRMEIRAALEAVRALDGPAASWSATRPTSSTASATAGGGAGSQRGWTTSAKKPVANRDLWEPLIDAGQRARRRRRSAG